ncbi:MAG: short-chain dehydrogenase [Deltaproteobacteria bacterium]|jgi:NAD(P)-dependent dehydrogenase (short-subunit alcohol dehydrogenase family)|nr:short-chain dehydrogenase [Deltaproteobacteria bacterium]
MSLETRLAIRDRVVWVVGAGGGGIGSAVACELAAAGAEVVAIDRDAAALEATLESIHADGNRVHARILDACDRNAMEDLMASERHAGRPPFGLVNIVGGLAADQFGPIVETSDETFDDVLGLNLRAAWLASQIFAREAIAAGSGGSVVQLASIAALEGMPFGAPYSAAKAALISLTRTQALEWGPHGIRVNAIAAGTIHVPRSTSQNPERDRRVLPLGRRGVPADIAGAALFLLSDLSAFVTGQVLAVDGGASAKPSYLDDDGLPVFVEDAALRARLTGATED